MSHSPGSDSCFVLGGNILPKPLLRPLRYMPAHKEGLKIQNPPAQLPVRWPRGTKGVTLQKLSTSSPKLSAFPNALSTRRKETSSPKPIPASSRETGFGHCATCQPTRRGLRIGLFLPSTCAVGPALAEGEGPGEGMFYQASTHSKKSCQHTRIPSDP